MPVGTPFHARTFPLCESLNYRDWSGYYTVSAYEAHHEHEYNAIRNAAALIDVSPLFKYIVAGPDADALVDRVITRDVAQMAVGQVFYTPWCDEHGHVIDDGTVSRLEEQRFRWTAAEPSLRWFTQNAQRPRRHDRRCVRESRGARAAGTALGAGAAALLGHRHRSIEVFPCDERTIGGVAVTLANRIHRRSWLRDLDSGASALTRVGRDVDAGRAFDVQPAGMLALDVARVEAGLLLIDVDFVGSKKATDRRSQRYTPYELGLGRLVRSRQGRVRRSIGAA